MKVIDGGRIQCRVRLCGTVHGKPFEYVDPPEHDGSQYIWREDEHGNVDPSEYWWAHGNMACDCNRIAFLPIDLVDEIPCDADGTLCGNIIRIDEIVPLENGPHGKKLPTLFLNETSRGIE